MLHLSIDLEITKKSLPVKKQISENFMLFEVFQVGTNDLVKSLNNRLFKDLTKSFVPTWNTSKSMKFSEICFLTGSDFLVISKSIDKCNMSLLMVVVLGIESTHHNMR